MKRRGRLSGEVGVGGDLGFRVLSIIHTPFRTAAADTGPSKGNGECRCGPKQDPLCQLKRRGWEWRSRLEKSTSIPAA